MRHILFILLAALMSAGCASSPRNAGRLTVLPPQRAELIRRAIALNDSNYYRGREIECVPSEDHTTVTVRIPYEIRPDSEYWRIVVFDAKTGEVKSQGMHSWSRNNDHVSK